MKLVKNVEKNYDETLLNEYANIFDIPKFAVEHLFNMGLNSKEDFTRFLHPNIDMLYDPFLLSGMSEAVERIQRAINNKECILIYGDYDVDGISATTVLYRYLKNCDAVVKYFIPSRNDDGYGLTIDTLKVVVEKFNPQLIITVDCGISCYEEVEYLKTVGVETIVTDHHDIPEKVPNTIVINAKLKNQKYPFTELCGAGVAYKLACALSGKKLEVFLPIVAIATVSDIVSLTDENRVIVSLGLSYWDQYLPYGIKRMCESLDLKTISAQDISFKLAPRINAPGRLGTPLDAVNLYLEKKDEEIDRILNRVNEINTQRQEYCKIVIDDVTQMLKDIDLNNQYAIILHNKKWEAGILGIACARISEEYNRPTFLFSNIGENIKGSGRSFGGINISKAIASCADLLQNFGGHAAAVGLEMKEENFEAFKQRLNEYISNNYSADIFTPVQHYDIELDSLDLTLSNMTKLAKLEPFGFGNPRPIYKISLDSLAIKKACLIKDSHLLIKSGKLDAIGFNMAHQLKLIKNSESASIVVDAQINEYKNKKSVKEKIMAVEVEKFNYESSFYFEFLYALENYEKELVFSLGSYTQLSETNFKEILSSLKLNPFGNVFMCSTSKGFKRLKEIKKYLNYSNIEFNTISNKSLINTLVFNPELLNIKGYKNFILLDDLYNKNYFCLLDSKEKNFYYYLDNNNVASSIINVNLDRETFKQYFLAIKNTLNKKKIFTNLVDMFFVFKKLNPHILDINFMQFAFCMKVFMQLNIINIQNTVNGNKYYLTNNTSNLENSILYTNIKKLKGV